MARLNVQPDKNNASRNTPGSNNTSVGGTPRHTQGRSTEVPTCPNVDWPDPDSNSEGNEVLQANPDVVSKVESGGRGRISRRNKVSRSSGLGPCRGRKTAARVPYPDCPASSDGSNSPNQQEPFDRPPIGAWNAHRFARYTARPDCEGARRYED